MSILDGVTTYGRGLRPTDIPSQFTLRVYKSRWSTNEGAERRAEEECNKHGSTHGYSTYEIVSQRTRWFPDCVEYVVRFH